MLRDLILRFGLPLIAVLGIVTVGAVPYVERMLGAWLRTDVEMQAKLAMNGLEPVLTHLAMDPTGADATRALARLGADERLLGIVLCTVNGARLYRSPQLPPQIDCPDEENQTSGFQVIQAERGPLHVARFKPETPGTATGLVMVAHDLSFIDKRQTRARDYLLGFAALGAIVLVLLCFTIAWLVWRGWIRRLLADIRARGFLRDAATTQPNDRVLDQVRHVLREMEQAQRMEVDFRENWTPEALQHVVREHLETPQLIAVSNREPYIHNHRGDGIAVDLPASGMVSALEPVMRACSGIWIAHGAGSADRATVDALDHVRVPPGAPTYTLRRVWMSEEEEQGYYYGFANEGLWPLCHLAFVRPAFRPADWAHYVAVNKRFADAVVREATDEAPLILVQDYHFALLPQLLRARLPRATIVVFWHIPWPNAETFGVCPWRTEVLKGMLAADIVGFHTQAHCHNFLETVDRYVESHIDHEGSTIATRNHQCSVASYPISIEWPPRWLQSIASVAECRRKVLSQFDLQGDVRIVVGVERWDFTKGIVDRLLALERLLETAPQWRGRIVLLQVAAPSRSKLPAYQELQRATHAAVTRLNQRFGATGYRPVVLIDEHCSPERVFELFRAADICIVNSLHDGMNLVAKEFVAARTDEEGVLILSTFAGASRELPEAVLVNPFDVDETARALLRALTMPAEERRARMRVMRDTVKQNNVFRWAGRMLMAAARIRQRQRLRALEASAQPGGATRRAAEAEVVELMR